MGRIRDIALIIRFGQGRDTNRNASVASTSHAKQESLAGDANTYALSHLQRIMQICIHQNHDKFFTAKTP